MTDHRWNDARRAVGRRRHHLAAGGILFVHGHCVDIQPVEQLFALVGRRAAGQFLPDFRRTAPHPEAAGKNPGARQPPVDAGHHHRRDPVQRRFRLAGRPLRALICQDHGIDGEPGRMTDAEQFCRRDEGVRNGGTAGHDIAGNRTLQLALRGDEPTAGRVPGTVCEHFPAAAKRAQAHAVRVQLGQHLIGKADVARRIKRYRPAAGQCQHPACFQRGNPVVRILRIERFGIKPEQP